MDLQYLPLLSTLHRLLLLLAFSNTLYVGLVIRFESRRIKLPRNFKLFILVRTSGRSQLAEGLAHGGLRVLIRWLQREGARYHLFRVVQLAHIHVAAVDKRLWLLTFQIHLLFQQPKSFLIRFTPISCFLEDILGPLNNLHFDIPIEGVGAARLDVE